MNDELNGAHPVRDPCVLIDLGLPRRQLREQDVNLKEIGARSGAALAGLDWPAASGLIAVLALLVSCDVCIVSCGLCRV